MTNPARGAFRTGCSAARAVSSLSKTRTFRYPPDPSVIQSADTKRLRGIAREIVDLANRARTKKLSADDVVGGTFTITNAGQYGTMLQFPIINQPQVAILSTDGIKRRPVVIVDERGNESIGIHSVGVLAMAWDHRAVDGAYAAAFLARLREIIETHDWDAELA